MYTFYTHRSQRKAALRACGRSPLHDGCGESLHSETELHGHPLPDGVGPEPHQDLRGSAHPVFE